MKSLNRGLFEILIPTLLLNHCIENKSGEGINAHEARVQLVHVFFLEFN